MIERLGKAFVSLVAEGRSQRAIAETMLDIRAEHAQARSARTRIRWFARSSAAIARVVLRILPRELGGLIAGGWTVRLGAWTLLLVLPMLVSPVMNLGLGADSRFPASTQLVLFATLLPQGLAVALPVAALLAALWPSRRSPPPVAVQGVAVVAIALTVILMVPVANQVFRQTAYAALTGTTPSMGVPERGLRELTAGELVRVAFGTTSEATSARRQAVMMTGLVAAAGTFTLLGGMLARRARRFRHRRCGDPTGS